MYLVIDTETTGLLLHPSARLEKQPKIIEWGSVLTDDDGVVLRERSELFDPGEPLPEEIIKITGITDDMLAGQRPFSDFLKKIREDFAMANTLVAHNLPFDLGVLECELRRAGIDDWPFPDDKVCTVQEMSEEWGTFPTLKALHQHTLGLTLDQRHRALDDVHALVRTMKAAGLFERS